MDYLKNLNKDQLEAVKHIDGPCLVMAGAGSGKTKVLTSRIVYLIENGIFPSNILAITFTNKAANEMRERVRVSIGETKAFIGTFHSFGLKIIRENTEEFGLTNKACEDFKVKVYTDIDVSGTGWETEIKNVLTNEQYGVKDCVDLLNEYYYEIQRLKCQLKMRTRQRNKIADFNVELMEENKKLKKALWEAEKNYIEEKCEFSIDIEKEMNFLKEDFEREYWND